MMEMSASRRARVSLAIGAVISCVFWFARDLGADGYNAMVYANLPAIATASLLSNNVHQPSAVAVVVTMVFQWALVAFAVLWIVGRLSHKKRRRDT